LLLAPNAVKLIPSAKISHAKHVDLRYQLSHTFFTYLLATMKNVLNLFACIMTVCAAQEVMIAQPYTEGTTRRRFAQMYLGADLQTQLAGGSTTFLGTDGEQVTTAFTPRIAPRLTVGGMHFWGHADFYVTFELPGTSTRAPSSLNTNNQNFTAQYALGVETGARVYPWRVERDAVRPFVGFSWSSGWFHQTNAVQAGERGSDGSGVRSEVGRVAIQTGAAYQLGDWIIEGGLRWFPAPRTLQYALSRSEFADVTLPNAAIWLGAKFTFETTLPDGMDTSAEAAFEERVRRYANKRRAASPRGLDSWTVAAGPSAIFTLGNAGADSYNASQRPYLAETHRIPVTADVGVGYYSESLDAQFNLAFRPMRSSLSAYGVTQTLDRMALQLEAYKFLFDYHGFVPFVGIAAGREFLRVRETMDSQTVTDVQQQNWSAGVVFGWDIRPSGNENWLLRTNLRYTPNVRLNLDKGAIAVPDFEFNFIQVVLFLDRMFR
jgi:hypothetical protein